MTLIVLDDFNDNYFFLNPSEQIKPECWHYRIVFLLCGSLECRWYVALHRRKLTGRLQAKRNRIVMKIEWFGQWNITAVAVVPSIGLVGCFFWRLDDAVIESTAAFAFVHLRLGRKKWDHLFSRSIYHLFTHLAICNSSERLRLTFFEFLIFFLI